MKKLYTLFMASAIAFAANSQLVFKEGFSGYTGTALGTQGSWVPGNGNPDVTLVPFPNATPLTYPGYNFGFGTYITAASVNGKTTTKNFIQGTPTTNNTTTTYMAFLVRVADAAATNAVYSVSLFDNSIVNNVARPLRFYISEDPANNTHVRFGLSIGSLINGATYTPASMNLTYGTTYFIVIRYDIVSGLANDNGYLWVNPNTVLEPMIGTEAVSVSNSIIPLVPEATVGSSLNAIEIAQSSNNNSPDVDYDAFLIANSPNSAIAWSLLTVANATLPVTLTSFNAAQDGASNNKLAWNVANETSIESYVIERSNDGQNFTAVGTVAATGTTKYNFTDVQITSDKTYYRLKMVEADGTFKLSNIVSLKAKLSTTIELSPNPVTNSLMIQHPKVTGDARIQLMNASGQFIREFRLSAGSVLSSIDMSGLTKGMYHVVYKNGTDVFTKTVLKQ